MTKTKPETEELKVEPITESEQKEIRIVERIIENREIAPQDAFGKMTKSQIALIKNTIAKGASDDELRMFIQVCKGAQLNPFLKQVHLVPRWDSKAGKEVRTIQVAIDGYRSVAESSGNYAGNDDAVYEGEETITISTTPPVKTIVAPKQATVTVYKMVSGTRCAFTATVRWGEYYPGPKNGFQWHQRPYLMLGKCAEALALRKAFPKLLSGMYAQEEMERGAEGDDKARESQSGLQVLIAAVEKSSLQDLKEYKLKMERSKKYTDDQKMEYLTAVDKRINELEAEAHINS